MIFPKPHNSTRSWYQNQSFVLKRVLQLLATVIRALNHLIHGYIYHGSNPIHGTNRVYGSQGMGRTYLKYTERDRYWSSEEPNRGENDDEESENNKLFCTNSCIPFFQCSLLNFAKCFRLRFTESLCLDCECDQQFVEYFLAKKCC